MFPTFLMKIQSTNRLQSVNNIINWKKIAIYFNFKMHKKAQSGKMKNLLSKRKNNSSNQLYTVTLMKLLPKNCGNVSWKHWLWLFLTNLFCILSWFGLYVLCKKIKLLCFRAILRQITGHHRPLFSAFLVVLVVITYQEDISILP